MFPICAIHPIEPIDPIDPLDPIDPTDRMDRIGRIDPIDRHHRIIKALKFMIGYKLDIFFRTTSLSRASLYIGIPLYHVMMVCMKCYQSFLSVIKCMSNPIKLN